MSRLFSFDAWGNVVSPWFYLGFSILDSGKGRAFGKMDGLKSDLACCVFVNMTW